jgi:hypothetical protein
MSETREHTLERACLAWRTLYRERDNLRLAAEARLQAIGELLSAHGCDCDCHPDELPDDVDPCLGCQVGSILGKKP